MSFGSFVLLPNITGSKSLRFIGDDYTGAFYATDVDLNQIYTGSSIGSTGILHLDASRSSSIYGNSTTVQPKSLIFNYVIKY